MVNVGVGYFSWIATEMVSGADEHPAFGPARANLPRPFDKTYPVSKVGDAVADAMVDRRRWVTVPGWVGAILLARVRGGRA